MKYVYPHDFEIEVTQQHIDDGKAMDATLCPIALAVADHFAHEYRVWVGPHDIYLFSAKIGPETTNAEYLLPLEAKAWLSAYDKRRLAKAYGLKSKHTEPKPITFAATRVRKPA